MNQAEQTYHSTINDWRRRQFKIAAYRRLLEQELDPASQDWDNAFEAMTQLEAEQERDKMSVMEARNNTNTIY